jgi:hypothetical protein
MGSDRFKKWEEYEDDIIKTNYSKIGPSGCSKLINRTIRACQLRAKKLNIKYDITKEYYEHENLENIVSKSFSYSDCLKAMNLSTRPGNYTTLKKYINLYKINIQHFYKDQTGGLSKYVFNIKKEINEILVENSTYSTSHLKDRLYKEGLKNRCCEICEQNEEWMGRKMSLILDHINGINNDNRIENLRIVCPNCNATLDTHCRGNKKSNDKIEKYCECGKKIFKSSIKCKKCDSIKQRKVERPSYNHLIYEVSELGYKATGRKYGVSDNTIRKWIKNI